MPSELKETLSCLDKAKEAKVHFGNKILNKLAQNVIKIGAKWDSKNFAFTFHSTLI